MRPKHDHPISSTAEVDAKADARSAEEAAIRRRWITLGEVLAVVAVIISALTLWNSWSQRADSEASDAAQARRTAVQAQTLTMTASPSRDRVLNLKPVSSEQSVQTQSILFPSALGLSPIETTGEPRIEAGWFSQALNKARGGAGLPDDSRGDERLPVVITTTYLVDGKTQVDVAMYDIGYTVSGRWLAGHDVKLRGISLISHLQPRQAQANLDTRWSKALRAE